ncbi:MAG: HAD family hydrolase [Anaerolineae bacterium]
MTNLTNLKAVLFDLDGTLIEHTWQLSQITQALFEKFAGDLAPLTCDEFYTVFWPKNADMWHMMADGVLDGDIAQQYSYANTLRALNKDPGLAAAMLNAWQELVLQEALPFDDTGPVLQTLRPHFTTGIVTNGFTSMQRAKISRHNLDRAVDFCLISEEAGCHKPQPRIFEKALQLAGNIAPHRAVLVGDTLTSDIEGALNAGLKAVFLNPRNDQTPPDGVPKITRLGDLLTLLPITNP